MATRCDISAEYARQLLNYDPKTGFLTWKARTPDMFLDGKRSGETRCKVWNEVHEGKVAIRKGGTGGHATVFIDGVSRSAASVVWLIHYGRSPERSIRFVSDDKMDMRICNLREQYTEAEKRERGNQATARWLANPDNSEKHRAAVALCRQRPHAKEKHRKRQLAYVATRRDQERQRAAEWREKNPERHAETHRMYYESNREKVKSANYKYRRENPEAYRQYARDYKARKRAGGGRLSRGYFDRLWAAQAGLCKACEGDLMILGTHLDHIIPLVKGGLHCDDNVQLLCATCNRRKSAKNFEDFLRELRAS